MKTKKTKIHKFLVLVPHRDIRIELQKYRDLALKAGLADVYNFPLAVPLASLSLALNDDELKQTARSMREIIGKNKIFTEENIALSFPCGEKELFLYGPRLNIVMPQDSHKNTSKKINYIFPSFVMGCLLKNENNTKFDILHESPQTKLGFRAAAVANMYWKPLQTDGEIYFKWKIGKLFWLPHP